MKKWFILLVLLVAFVPSVSSAEIPKHIPNYYWQTDFEVINKENQLIRVTDANGPSSPNGGDLYFVKNLSINIESSPLVRVFFEFSNNKFSAIVINVYDQRIYRQLLSIMRRDGVPLYSNYEASGEYQQNFHIASHRTLATHFYINQKSNSYATIILRDDKYLSPPK